MFTYQMRDPRLYITMADAPSNSENKSLTIGALPDNPPTTHMLEFEIYLQRFHIYRKQNPIRVPIVGANAHPRLRTMVKIVLSLWRCLEDSLKI